MKHDTTKVTPTICWSVSQKLRKTWFICKARTGRRLSAAYFHCATIVIAGCAVAQHCYNGDVSFLWGKMEILTPVKSKPLNRLTHNLSGLIRCTRGVFVPNLVKIRDFWAKGWNITFCVTIFFSDQRREETAGRILTRNGSKDAKSRKDVPFWGYKMKNWNLTHYTYPNSKKLSLNSQFPAKMMKHETPSISKSTKPIEMKINNVRNVIQSTRMKYDDVTTNPIWRTAAILKIVFWLYLAMVLH